MLAATSWGTGQVLFDMLWFVLFVIEIWLTFSIFVDLFRRHDIRGWVKAVWVLAVILFPLIGIVAYLIIYGDQMRVHAHQQAADQEAVLQDHLRQLTGGAYSPSEELNRLADLRDRGIIDDEEFAKLKHKVVHG